MATNEAEEDDKPKKRESKFAKLIHRFKNDPPMSRDQRHKEPSTSSISSLSSSPSLPSKLYNDQYNTNNLNSSFSPTRIAPSPKLNMYISDDTYSTDYDEEIHQLNMMADVALEKLKTDLELERSLQHIKERLQLSTEMEEIIQQRKELEITNRYIASPKSKPSVEVVHQVNKSIERLVEEKYEKQPKQPVSHTEDTTQLELDKKLSVLSEDVEEITPKPAERPPILASNTTQAIVKSEIEISVPKLTITPLISVYNLETKKNDEMQMEQISPMCIKPPKTPKHEFVFVYFHILFHEFISILMQRC